MSRVGGDRACCEAKLGRLRCEISAPKAALKYAYGGALDTAWHNEKLADLR
jgi:hypothetical protein